MSEATPSSSVIRPILVCMGKCRSKSCKGYKSYGPAGTQCPGNNKYSTRRSCHLFQPFWTQKEQLDSNKVDFSDSIGICEGVSCFSIGYPGMVCMECCKRGNDHHYLAVSHQSYTDAFVRYYSLEQKGKKSHDLKRVNVEFDLETVDYNSFLHSCDLSVGSEDVVNTSFESIISPPSNVNISAD